MIATILTVSLALYWLLRESDWLRVNLMTELCQIGACSDWRLQDSQVTDDMKIELRRAWFSNNGDKYSKILDSHLLDGQPLCGWGYAYQFRDFKPEYKIELIDGTYKQTMQTDNIAILRDAFRVNRNPYIKVKI